jgi:hypothetical protein
MNATRTDRESTRAFARAQSCSRWMAIQAGGGASGGWRSATVPSTSAWHPFDAAFRYRNYSAAQDGSSNGDDSNRGNVPRRGLSRPDELEDRCLERETSETRLRTMLSFLEVREISPTRSNARSGFEKTGLTPVSKNGQHESKFARRQQSPICALDTWAAPYPDNCSRTNPVFTDDAFWNFRACQLPNYQRTGPMK